MDKYKIIIKSATVSSGGSVDDAPGILITYDPHTHKITFKKIPGGPGPLQKGINNLAAIAALRTSDEAIYKDLHLHLDKIGCSIAQEIIEVIERPGPTPWVSSVE
jgi:hypothetical protein